MTHPTQNPTIQFDADTYRRAQECVHCGLCLPACPTYTQNGLEADSPRGRIYLMKAIADGRLQVNDRVTEHLDLCLDCRACESACPSGVKYHQLIESAREQLRSHRKPTGADWVVEKVFLHLFPYPTRLKLALAPARILQKVGMWDGVSRLVAKLFPTQIQKMQSMLPEDGPLWTDPPAERYEAYGTKRMTVGMLSGCIGSVIFDETNRKTIELLRRFGCEVVIPPSQVCCGAIHHHAGYVDPAIERAKKNIRAFKDVDIVVSNIAGCGAMLKDYGHLLRDDPDWSDESAAFSNKCKDICELLMELDLPDPPHEVPLTITYHDACHLAHAQKVTAAPRKLLSRVRGLTLVPLTESDMCCGAAGTYNLSQPEMASELGERKIKHIDRTGASTCVTGNVGCAMQIQSEANRMGKQLDVAHTVDILYRAYFG